MKIKLQNFNYKSNMKYLLMTEHNTSYRLDKRIKPESIQASGSGCDFAANKKERETY